MTEEEIFAEIRSVFQGPMDDNIYYFNFTILQPSGGGSNQFQQRRHRTNGVPPLWQGSSRDPQYIFLPKKSFL